MNINAVDKPQSGWVAPEKKEFGADSEINKLTTNIEKEESELSKLSEEFTKHVSKGEKDMAQLKSAVIQQKQMAIQTLRLQIDKLKKPEQKNEDNGAVKGTSETVAAKAVAMNPTKNPAWGELSPRPEQPAAILELSPYAAKLFSHED